MTTNPIPLHTRKTVSSGGNEMTTQTPESVASKCAELWPYAGGQTRESDERCPAPTG